VRIQVFEDAVLLFGGDLGGVGRARWMMRWKPALNAFAITFGDRFPAAETY
jgi:putative transposase